MADQQMNNILLTPNRPSSPDIIINTLRILQNLLLTVIHTFRIIIVGNGKGLGLV